VSRIAIATLAAALTTAGVTAAAGTPGYTRAATQSCLMALPNAVAGLPPATPPRPAALFVERFADLDLSTTSGLGPRARPHTQLGAWTGTGAYQGIVLSFFADAASARASFKSVAWLYGGRWLGNVVASWDQKHAPASAVRTAVLGCLRSRPVPPRPHPSPPATLATFAGLWGGHTRGLTIGATGRAQETVDDGCCTRSYAMRFRLLSVHGTLTHAVARYRISSYARSANEAPSLHAGQAGELVLDNGIVTNRLTHVYYCSEPAWSATGACGA